MKRRVIDKRRKEKYMLDDEYLNGQAKLCGWKGTIVYNSLCRHTNKAQECFPSIELIAEQHGVSRPTIIDGLNRLEKNRIIEIYKTKNAKGQWLNNTYILLDKSEWIYEKLPGNKRGKHLSKTQVNKIDVDSPSKQEYKTKSIRIQNQVNKIDSKETHIRKHIKGNTYIAKETFAFSKQLLKMEKDQRHIQIIALYWKYKEFNFDNKEQYQSSLKRDLKPASALKGYSNDKISKVMAWLDKNMSGIKWTLETIHKYIDEDLSLYEEKAKQQYGSRF